MEGDTTEMPWQPLLRSDEEFLREIYALRFFTDCRRWLAVEVGLRIETQLNWSMSCKSGSIQKSGHLFRQGCDFRQWQHGDFFVRRIGVYARIDHPQMAQIEIRQGYLH